MGFELPVNNLEMYKAPKLILYDPKQPDFKPDEAVINHFYYRSTARSNVPKFTSSVKVSILLVMKASVYENALEWKENKLAVRKFHRALSYADTFADDTTHGRPKIQRT